MPHTQMLEVQQGIWIDKRWLKSAGLGSHLLVMVQAGEIRIITAPSPKTESLKSSNKGWDVFRSLGNNVSAGKLEDASINHDRYLYGTES